MQYWLAARFILYYLSSTITVKGIKCLSMILFKLAHHRLCSLYENNDLSLFEGHLLGPDSLLDVHRYVPRLHPGLALRMRTAGTPPHRIGAGTFR